MKLGSLVFALLCVMGTFAQAQNFECAGLVESGDYVLPVKLDLDVLSDKNIVVKFSAANDISGIAKVTQNDKKAMKFSVASQDKNVEISLKRAALGGDSLEGSKSFYVIADMKATANKNTSAAHGLLQCK